MTQFKSQKIKKQKLVGIPGTANLVFNVREMRYYDAEGYKEILDGSDPTTIGFADKNAGVYSPFDDQYYERNEKSRLFEKMPETDWNKFITKEKVDISVQQEQEKRDKDDNMMLELGLDPSMDEIDDYDVDKSSYDEENFEPLEPDDQGF
jgi:hypothetical protein